MESFGLQQNKESAPERESFDVEKGLSRERTILGRFREKAKDVARVMLFVSALTAGSVLAKETYAGEKEIPTKIENSLNAQKEQGAKQETESERDTTISSKWAEEYVARTQTELTNIKTKEDAHQFVINFVDKFIGEFYLPTEGQIIKDSAYGVVGTRIYTEDDLNVVLEQTVKTKDIIRNLILRIYPDTDIASGESEFYQHRLSQISDITRRVKRMIEHRQEIADPTYLDKQIEQLMKEGAKDENSPQKEKRDLAEKFIIKMQQLERGEQYL